MDWYHSPQEVDKIGDKLIEILKNYYSENEEPVLNYRSKQEILEQFACPEPPDHRHELGDVLNQFKDEIMPLSVKTWHPKFMNQMFAGASFPSIIGDLIASMMNPTLATWEMSPVATYIEHICSSWMAQILGMREGSSGIFLPGGSMSNLLAMVLARHKILGSEVREVGMQKMQSRPVIICSKNSHYSIANAANLLGIGTENVIQIETNHRQEMLPSDLERQLNLLDREGKTPIAVVATLGITVTGGFDPLKDILKVCEGRNIHVHADAAFGGGMCLTSQKEHLFDGLDKVDSVTWDTHKTMHTPLTCSVLLVPNVQELKPAFSHKADYLFHPQETEELEDLGKFTILCGKRFDALKVWLLWQTYGTKFFADVAESRLELVQDFYKLLKEDPDFTPSYEPVSPILCFQYTPGGKKREDSDRIHRLIRERIKQSGEAYFNVSQLNDEIHFRTILINPLTTIEDLQEIVIMIKNEGQKV